MKIQWLEKSFQTSRVSATKSRLHALRALKLQLTKKADSELFLDLKVLPGIGPVREENLKQQGYGTIEDLENHPLWKKPASEFMKIINKKEIGSTQKWLWQRLPKSHPLLHYLAGFCQDQDFAIVDIETLGLSERPIILLGIAKPSKNHVCTSQFLLRDIQDEPGAIWSLVSELESSCRLLVSTAEVLIFPTLSKDWLTMD